MQRWSEEEIQYAILAIQEGKGYKEISGFLDRSDKSVRLKLNKEGLFMKDYELKKEPLYCLECGKQLQLRWQKTFCSHSCSATYNNRLRSCRIHLCRHCGNEIQHSHRKVASFCSHKCFQNDRYYKTIDAWKRGEFKGWVGKVRSLSVIIRRYLKDKHGTACMKCGWDKKHPVDGKSLTEINHIDGDAENCKEENLEILCPNCHSMTPNFRARNKNSKRNRKNSPLV